MIEMLYVVLLEIIVITCIGCRYAPTDDDDHQLAIELARASAKMHNTICANLIFTRDVEDIYGVHGRLLHAITSCAAESSFMVTMRTMANKKLQILFQEALPEITKTCSKPDILQAFENVCQQKYRKSKLNDRMKSWVTFITKLAQVQQCMRSDRLPRIWFPSNYDSNSERAFISQNASIALDEHHKKYLKVDTVITFLPLALMAQHDPEVFVVMRKRMEFL